MNDTSLNLNLYMDNLLVISNYIELGSKVITKIAGNDISTKVDNDELSRAIRGLIAAQLGQKTAHLE